MTLKVLTVLTVAMLAAHAAALPSMSKSKSKAKADSPPQDQIAAAFEHDGFRIEKWETSPGAQGAIALHHNLTNLRTKEPKMALYASGDAYGIGYVTAKMVPHQIEVMLTTYIERFIPQLIDYDWWKKNQGTEMCQMLEKALSEALIKLANESFTKMHAQGVFPEELVEEMRGIHDGIHAVNASSVVTIDRLITVNYGFDFLSALAFAGELGPTLAGLVESMPGFSAEGKRALAQLLREPTEPMLRHPAYCDAFMAWGNATKTPGEVVFGRAFQLVTSEVFQDFATHFIAVPNDGRFASVRVMAPGMVGAITSLGAGGVVLGVDTLRSSAATPKTPGLNSILMVRHVAETAFSTEMAVELMESALRGCPWLYPMCDTTGDCAVVEAGASTTRSAADFDPLRYVRGKEDIMHLLPNASFIQKHLSTDAYRSGMYVRKAGYQYPEAYLQFNQKLFEHFHVPFDGAQQGENGTLFDTWQHELEFQKTLENHYFPPLRTGSDDMPDFLLVSNLAVVPEMRLTMMGTMSDLLAKTGESAQYRYDRLNQQVRAAYGSLDEQSGKHAITFLSPDRTPGYWNHEAIPGNPMSAQIEGAVSVAVLSQRIRTLELNTKTGYWADDFYKTSLQRYVVW